jgi:tetraacyldisaccharide 4'-kinase
VGAFCGLGNPLSFHRTLDHLGLNPLEWVEFEDHHRYRPSELRRMADHFRASGKGITSLLTTEKDAVNLCDDCDNLVAPLEIYWLEIGMRIEHEEEFARALERTRTISR